jgi:hypothetical protein
MTNSPDNADQPTNKPTSEQPKDVQDPLDNQGCPPLASLFAPDLAMRPSASNSGTSRRSSGKGRSKGGGGAKRIANSGGSTGRLKKKPKTRKKITVSKTFMLKRS